LLSVIVSPFKKRGTGKWISCNWIRCPPTCIYHNRWWWN
jgi:hypothetical protein